MKNYLKKLGLAATFLGTYMAAGAQQIKFVEYDLANGLHVILHQDKAAPVIAVSVMYHVGSKNEIPSRTGFAHFFEHLLFEGTENIKRGEFMKIISNNGGINNANTSQDRTFYFEQFPSNQLKLGLWLEAERMRHPVINEIGVKTQNEVVKEEKRMRIDNVPYGKFGEAVFKNLFKNHPYRWQVIGSMEHLDAARLDEFKDFFKKYYTPNNAVLTVAGDIDIAQAKEWINTYFATIPRGVTLQRNKWEEQPITKEIIDTTYDANLQLPALILSYRTPAMSSRETAVMDVIASILSGGSSSKLPKKLVDEKKNAVQAGAFNFSLEDYGAYCIYALPSGNHTLDELQKDIDEEIEKISTELISDEDYQKQANQFENSYISQNSKMLGIAENLSNGYTFYKNTNRLNEELKQRQSITKEEIRDVARKYLGKNQRVRVYYLAPKQKGF